MSDSSRRSRQEARRQAIAEAVMREGALRLEDLATRFEVSLMTIHRDVDDLEAREILRKYRGLVTALATSVVESSVAFRVSKQFAEKQALCAEAARPPVPRARYGGFAWRIPPRSARWLHCSHE